MVPEDHLRERARMLILAGTVPARRPDRIWGGRGSGDCCPVCEATVGDDETEMELEFARDGVAAIFHVHLACFAALEQERRQLAERDDAELPAPGEYTGLHKNGHRYLNGS